MADQLATPLELASALQQDLDLATATVWLNAATAVVQAAADNQRILQVVNDTVTMAGYASQWLQLAQIPVTAVASVTLDGVVLTAVDPGGAVTGYRRVGNRLWRTASWQTYVGEPSHVVIVDTHGYASGDQNLELARAATLAIAKTAYVNPGGATSEKIDDYAVAYDRAAAAMEASPHLKAALYRKYGRRAGLVRIG